jgi:RNA-directed DNA polymerase
MKRVIGERLAECKLELHPEKTTIIYCKDEDRGGTYLNERFDFLGYTFRPRRSRNRWGKFFINFSPAVSDKTTKAMRRTMRSWTLQRRSDKSLDDLSRMFNPILRGWITYYGQYYKSALYPTFLNLNRILARWAMRKYKRLRRHSRRAGHWLGRIARQKPKMFGHWEMGLLPTVGR